MRESIGRDVERAARVLGVQLLVLEVWHAAAFERVLNAAIRQGTGALLIPPGILFTMHQRRLAALAAQYRLPAIYWPRPFVEAGGLMVYGPSAPDLWRRVAALVDKILQGTKPADLPVEQPMKFELVLNLKTAQTLDLTIPPGLVFQADEVIR